MTRAADWDVVVGYADRLSVRPGERLRVMASCAGELEASLVDLVSGDPAPASIEGLTQPAAQPVRTGSSVEVAHHPALRPTDGLDVDVWVWLAPGAPRAERRALIASWGPDGGDGWGLVLDAQRRPRFEVSSGGELASVTAGEPAPLDGWWRIEGRLDPSAQEISVTRRDLGGTVRDRASAPITIAPGGEPGPLTIGAERRGDGAIAESHLDGKLADPRVRSGEGLVAAWSLGDGREQRVADNGPLGLDGVPINGPLRAVTGPAWDGDVHDWRFADRGYEAMHFHSDAVDDLGWEPALEIAIDPECGSGLYAAVLACGEVEDVIPFVVRADARASRLVLLPTFTYLAYSCERDADGLASSTQSEDVWVRASGLRSLYDRYDDGCAVYEASLRRPLTQLRPQYRCSQHGGPHGLAQDLLLLRFLSRRGLDFDLSTDHDVHTAGAEALRPYRSVITGAHPEYATLELLEALEAHVGGGGALAYLGGNGFNGRVSVDPHRPHALELRRTETQALAWQALPGEHHHAFTGGYGGDWRRQGHPEHRFLGVGLSAFGYASAGSYERARTEEPAAEIAFDGIEPGMPVGYDGVVLGGAAGFEIDNHDPVLGSPDDSVVLATASVGADYSTWPDDVRDGSGPAPKRRADMVLRRAEPSGGTVFSVGSIAWTGCLVGDDSNPVARVTENVLRELDRERPFREGE